MDLTLNSSKTITCLKGQIKQAEISSPMIPLTPYLQDHVSLPSFLKNEFLDVPTELE